MQSFILDLLNAAEKSGWNPELEPGLVDALTGFAIRIQEQAHVVTDAEFEHVADRLDLSVEDLLALCSTVVDETRAHQIEAFDYVNSYANWSTVDYRGENSLKHARTL
ncbi:hypothetical protein ACN20G_23305 [Streptomyces sp. BI20]|uniref:hypothetical protein n=1 Tax=Streptomyces sp. BI20 TaxID=3403460 RepID=UPI003C7662D0